MIFYNVMSLRFKSFEIIFQQFQLKTSGEKKTNKHNFACHDTLLGSNIPHPKALLKMNFLFGGVYMNT